MIQENGLSSAPVHGIVRLPPPYYDEDGITIYCADCLEILPFIESVDVTFSSPPYNTIAATNPSGMMAEHNHKQNIDTHATEGAAQAVCRMLQRDGFGGQGRVFPLSTRVEKVD